MITKQEIIYKLYPNIRTLRGQQSGQEATSWDAFDIDGNPVDDEVLIADPTMARYSDAISRTVKH